MIEQKQEVFWLTSADRQRLLYVSPAFEALWGHPLERLYSYPDGHLGLIVDSIHPSDRERVIVTLAQQDQDEYKIEYRIVRLDGSIRWVRSRSFAIRISQSRRRSHSSHSSFRLKWKTNTYHQR